MLSRPLKSRRSSIFTPWALACRTSRTLLVGTMTKALLANLNAWLRREKS
jgi:hypothetical protein